jgi:hypothetical protein
VRRIGYAGVEARCGQGRQDRHRVAHDELAVAGARCRRRGGGRAARRALPTSHGSPPAW